MGRIVVAPAPDSGLPLGPTRGAGKASGDRPVRWRRCLVLAALTPLGLLLQTIAAQAPEWVEHTYARGIYPFVQETLSALARSSPIAIGETLLLLLVLTICLRTGRGVVGLCRGRRSLLNLAGHGLAQAAAVFGVLYLLFMLLWGFNHARLPFATQISLHPAAVEPARLARVALRLAQRADAERPPEPESERPHLDPSFADAISAAYDAAGKVWPVLAGPRPVIRAAWLSRWMTLGSITGIYSPFTGEANVNVDLPQVVQPFVACHEVAHLRGYAREDEANFIAWWVGSRSDDRSVAYSCDLMAFRATMIALEHASFVAWMEVRIKAPSAVMEDSVAIDRFWDGQPKLATRVLSAVTTATNDLYLKSSGHAEGVRSYGRMVDLLIAALDP